MLRVQSMLVKLPQAFPAYIFPFVSLVSQGVFDCGSPEYQLTPASPFRESYRGHMNFQLYCLGLQL